KNIGSVGAPTAGFHLSDRLLAQIRKKGVQIEYVTLHVGIGTFWPVKTENLEEHKMHSEIVEINPDTAQRINKAKREKRRVIAVGTTVVRALEGAAQIAESNGGRAHCVMPLPVYGFSGKVDIFIKPGYRFLIVDALLTNFHLPKSTLLVLVSAFVGREKILQAYQSAIKNNYRFYSFGDAMFINKKPSAFYADGCYGF
ncbi:S-adenosylmethionine:tRNA ribosyltransferase-isomerase, partial [Candidatus Parcubacteria bacterium]